MLEPQEAPQGPTCIYRPRSGKRAVTVAIETMNFAQVKPRIRQRRQINISTRGAFCGFYGQPLLYLPLSGGRVLSISGSCKVAAQFAEKAVPRLGS
jgi:hypothetical protein